MRTLRGKLILLLIVAGLAPLFLFGVFSLYNSQKSLRQSVQESFREITVRSAEEINLFLNHSRQLLETLATDLTESNLSITQQHRIIENYVIRFPQFLKILVYDKKMELSYSTEVNKSSKDHPKMVDLLKTRTKNFHNSKPYLSEDLTPVLWFFVPVGQANDARGVFAAQLDLMAMWQWVEETHLGKQGYASVVDEKGEMIASGDPYYKRTILSSEEPVYLKGFDVKKVSPIPQIEETSQGKILMSEQKISDNPKWFLVFTQPTREAFALLKESALLLLMVATGGLLLMWIAAVLGSRRTLLKPVAQLTKATGEIGGGNLDYRVKMKTKDELGQLGESINQMAADLSNQQETIRKQERLAMFGRMASGLAHDLKHPVKNVESAAKLMEEMYTDPEYRQTFTRVVQREFNRINQFLEDLRNVTHEMPYHPTHVDIITLLQEVVESFQADAKEREAKLIFKTNQAVLTLEGDPHLLRRLFENMVSNALQALDKPDGRVMVQADRSDGRVKIEVSDTGMGIPQDRLAGLFDEFTTTKRKGLGLGLAISKKIIDLHQGRVRVDSQVGEGTTFHLSFPMATLGDFKIDG